MLRGRYACNAVVYEVSDEFDTSFNFHCSRCRAATGSAFRPCSFDLEGVHAGRTLDPGQTETWTVALAPGTYRFHCDVFPEGMKGTFTVTP